MYSDIDSGQSREIDLVAFLNVDHGQKPFFYEVQLVIECKKSDAPLVVLASDSSVSERYEYYFGNETATSKTIDNGAAYFNLHDLTRSDRVRKIGRFSEFVRAGYSMVPCFKESDANIYKGVVSLAKANEYYRNEYHRIASLDEDAWFRMQLPTLVVDAPLFLAFTDNKGDIEVEESDWCSLLFRLPWNIKRAEQDRLCNIQVVRREYFESFLSEVANLHQYLIDSEGVLFRA